MNELSTFQAEVGEWAKHNFPEATAIQPLIGIAEECGELCHAHLKAMQGIRGTPAKHLAAKKDAVGDLIIFLAHYCALTGNDLFQSISQISTYRPYPNPLLDLIASVGFLARCHTLENGSKMAPVIAELVQDLAVYCGSCDIDFKTAVLDTWAEVRQRDWSKNKKDGLPPVVPQPNLSFAR